MKILNKIFVFLISFVLLCSLTILFGNLPVWKIFLVKDWGNFNLNTLLQDNNKPSGHISYIEGSGLKRKSENDGYFQDIKLNSPVFMGDMIITDNKTKAVIMFEQNNQIEISESSIIKLDFSKNEEKLVSISKMPKIEILKGQVNENGTDNKIEIKRDIASIKHEVPKPQTMKISKIRMDKIFPKKVETPKMQEKQLDVIIEEPIIQNVVEQETEKVVVPKHIEKKKIPLSEIKYSSKIAGNSYVNSNEYKGESFNEFFVDINWAPVLQASHYLVEFYDSKGQKWNSVKTTENRYRLEKMFYGKIEYEVIAFRNNDRISLSKKDKLEFNFQAPKIKNPSNNIKLNISDKKYLFSWDKKNFTTDYLIEISQNKNFEEAFSQKTKANFIQIPLGSGKYYWRVYSIHKELRSPASQPSVFTIE